MTIKIAITLALLAVAGAVVGYFVASDPWKGVMFGAIIGGIGGPAVLAIALVVFLKATNFTIA